DSSISFETYKVLDLSIFSFIGFFMLALIFIAYVLLTDKLLVVFANLGLKKAALTFISLQVVLFTILFLFPVFPYVSIESLILFSVTSGLAYFYRFRRKSEYKFSNFITFVIIFSIFSLIEVTKYSEIRHRSEMKVLAVNLSAEHDPIAEILFQEIDEKIRQDDELEGILFSPVFDFEYLYSTVERKYFSGFWDKYDLQITICAPFDSVYVSPPEDSWYPCYPFFYEDILSEGMQVPGTKVYYLDNLNGRISYFLSITYNEGRDDELTLFIELDSRFYAEGLGYPGLLLEDSYTNTSERFSYAKYNNDRLITSNGDFAYSTNSSVYVGPGDGFETFKYDNYDHLAYHLDNKNIIIVSKPSVFWVDVLISFSYIFSFYFLVLVILLLVSKISPLSLRIKFNFKNRIQFSITSVLLVSFVLFGIGTVYFSIQQYKDRQLEILEEKVQSVYIELIHKLEFETDLKNWTSESYYSLNELLRKFSNVFYTDINLFEENGRLLATSRSEIYDMGLISRRMNAPAYKELTVNKRSEYIHTEKIGNLKYLSVYVPFMNADNKMLAYLNLPYFTRQDELTREVANLIVAIINIVVLLSLLSFTIAVFVSNTVTSPLRIIQQKIAKISLSEKNEKIEYSSRDEIGSLVNEYNQMVDQLQDSAELLAKSERESAWREMAKQIAHEIKNPLTPMKLSVQHLQRAYSEHGRNSKEQVDKITKMLVQQIDDLSSIATEFSNFAKMPLANNEKLNLVKKLNNTIELFTDYNRCIISLDINTKEDVYVYADREQLSRVFINLIKNSIQSIPENRKGKIEIKLELNEDRAVVSISDNGKGISDDIKDKLFQPNFTTKSSGMGLGLSIVKNIISNAGGKIYYETREAQGTTFYIELPVFEESENNVSDEE
ncbi:MAG: ATP-binding protein, partial [Bacteroidales bacterium]